MIPSTKRAAKDLNPDPGSWSKRRIEHRAYRQMPLLPEEEETRPRSKKSKTHIHKWGPWEFQRTACFSWWRNKKVETNYYIRSCKKCGYKNQRIEHHHRISRS